MNVRVKTVIMIVLVNKWVNDWMDSLINLLINWKIPFYDKYISPCKITNTVQKLRRDWKTWKSQSDTSQTVNVTSHDTSLKHRQKQQFIPTWIPCDCCSMWVSHTTFVSRKWWRIVRLVMSAIHWHMQQQQHILQMELQ